MGRASVRATIAAYFAPGNVAGLSTTYRARPKEIPAQAFKLSVGSGSGAVLVIHMPNDDEKRIAMGGATSGGKFDVHDVAMEILFASTKPDALAAQDDHDALIDAFMARFHADRTFGSTNGVPIFQAGEGPAGIRIELTEPVLSKQSFILNGVIRFEAEEWVLA